jgi:hypothetical protein
MPYQMTDFSSLATLIQSVCSLVSLPAPADPAGSTDTNIALMRTAANFASLEMLNAYEWSQLTKRGSLTVYTATPPVPGAPTEVGFDLPEDFYRMIDQTTSRFGPVAPQGWMISPNSSLAWQIRQRQIWFLAPPPAPGQPFDYMYLSRALVQDADDPALYKNVASKNGDVFQLDGILMSLLTRVKWLEAKGFDSSAAVRDFLLAFDSRIGAEKGANVLNMVGPPARFPLINTGNLPSSLYGYG